MSKKLQMSFNPTEVRKMRQIKKPQNKENTFKVLEWNVLADCYTYNKHLDWNR